MSKRTIYKIMCPITGDVKYVGQTLSMKVRFMNHKTCNKSAIGKWLNQSIKYGRNPQIVEIEIVDKKQADEKEFEWIGFFINKGHKLFNVRTSIKPQQQNTNKRLYTKNTNPIVFNKDKYKDVLRGLTGVAVFEIIKNEVLQKEIAQILELKPKTVIQLANKNKPINKLTTYDVVERIKKHTGFTVNEIVVLSQNYT